MKPCFRNRKLIAWLALGELDAPRAEALYAHMRHCPGCRHYLEEMSAVAGCLAAGPAEPELEPSASFHRKLLGRLRGERNALGLGSAVRAPQLAAGASGPGRCRALAPDALLAPHPAVLTTPVRVSHLAAPPPTPARGLSPTMANYERAASRSLDEFDDLLTQQARQNLPSAPNFTATFALSAGASD